MDYVVYGLLAAMSLAAAMFLKIYLRTRGPYVVQCPENKQRAVVKLDGGYAAATGVSGTMELRLSDCSRWPGKLGCGQECVAQIAASPDDCRLPGVLAKWYEGKACTFCGKPFNEVEWLPHKPAMRSPEGRTIEWWEMRPEELLAALGTHQPVCWNCHIAETFRRLYPDLVSESKDTAHPTI